MTIKTRSVVVRAPARRAFVDLTDPLRTVVRGVGLADGIAVAFCAHTTCTLILNEWEAGAHTDFRRVLDSLVPCEGYYRHDDLSYRTQNLQEDEPANGHAHVAQMLAGATSQLVPVAGGDLVLGRWQRLMLLELDEPRDRSVFFVVMAESVAAPLTALRGDLEAAG